MTQRKTLKVMWQLTAVSLMAALVLAACATPTTPTATAVPPTTVPPTAPPTAVPPTNTPEPVAAPALTEKTVLQDFESADAKVYDGYQATASIGDVAQTGAGSLKSFSETGEWHGVGVEFAAPVNLSEMGKFCFWAYDTTANNDGQAKNTVGVKLFDAAGKSTERYTDNEGVGFNPKTKKDAWMPMCLNLITFTDIDLTQVAKVEFTMYWAGTYYFDELMVLTAEEALEVPATTSGGNAPTIVGQDMETEGQAYVDWQATIALTDTEKHGGKFSLAETSDTGEWHTIGITLTNGPVDASGHDQMCFWVMDNTGSNDGKGNNSVGVRLIDADGGNQELWSDNEGVGTNPKTATGEWVQICQNLSAYTDVNLAKLVKVQFAMYWAGTYYWDDVTFVSAGAKPVSIQDMETEGQAYVDWQATIALTDTEKHGGKFSLAETSDTGEWHTIGITLTNAPVDASGHDRLCFWVMDNTGSNDGKGNNSVGVRLIDADGGNQELWSDNEGVGTNPKTATGEWVQICQNLSAYTDVNLAKLVKVQFAMYWAGTYYWDDVTLESGAAPQSLTAQDMETEGQAYVDWQATIALSDKEVHGGKFSLEETSDTGEWHTIGITLTNAPVDATPYGKLCFWVMDNTGSNDGKGNNSVGVRLIDADGGNQELWSDNEGVGANPKTATGEWVQICQNLSAYTDVNLAKLVKVQFAMYWAGTYYWDDVTLEP